MGNLTRGHGAAVALVLGAAALSALEGLVTWQSLAARASVLVVAGVAAVLAVVAGANRQEEPSRAWLASTRTAIWSGLRRPTAATLFVGAWLALFAAAMSWDLTSLLEGTRARPTLSKLIGQVTRHDAGRAALFFVWLLLGATFCLAGRARDGSGNVKGDPGRDVNEDLDSGASANIDGDVKGDKLEAGDG